MIFKRILALSFITILFTSCVSVSKEFYQVYDVSPINMKTVDTLDLFFEDENCIITYDLWSNGGNIGFNFYNKTNQRIEIDLKETNFIKNAYAFDYFKNRTYSSSKANSASASSSSGVMAAVTGVNLFNDIQTNLVKKSTSAVVSSFREYSISIDEASIISIPPKSQKRIAEYFINKTLIRNCDLIRYPTKSKVTTSTYTVDKSPIIFSNIITYLVGLKKVVVANDFYVSGITNYPNSEFFDSEQREFCGYKNPLWTKYPKYATKNRFYILYSRK